MHLDVSVTPIVMKEVIKSWAKSDEVLKEDKKLPVTAKRSFDAWRLTQNASNGCLQNGLLRMDSPLMLSKDAAFTNC